jgi:hypothetical protein
VKPLLVDLRHCIRNATVAARLVMGIIQVRKMESEK